MNACVLLGNAETPISKILCVGRNYAAHAEEMGAAPPAEPILFFKPHTALARPAGGDLHVPEDFGELHHEIELVFILGAGGRNVAREEGGRLISGCGVGIDLTLREIQSAAKQARAPWAVSKGFDGSAPVGDFVTLDQGAAGLARRLHLEVNGETRQSGSSSAMIFSPGEIISHASRFFTLEAGDLIFTGTPPGVGPLLNGDRLSARIDGLPELSFTVKRG